MTEGPCKVIESFETIGSKWKLIIINDLMNGEKRFNQIKESTEASSRTLSRVLKELEKEQIVEKRVEKDPIASYYKLTEKGLSLENVFTEINTWAEQWLETESTNN